MPFHRRTSLLLLGSVMAACASSPPPATEPAVPVTAAEPEPPEETISEGLQAARLGDLAAAIGPLAHAARVCAGTEAGDRATLALLGLLTDPRNPRRDLDGARRIAERWLASPSTASWIEPLMEALYLVTLDLGGAPDDAPHAAEPPRPVAPAAAECEASPALGPREPHLPALPGRPTRDALTEAEAERARLAELASRLEARVAELEAELERIRKTIRP